MRTANWGIVRKQRSGRFAASYTFNGVEIRCPLGTFRTQGDARRWLAEERRLIERGDWLPFDQRHDGTLPEPEPVRVPTVGEYVADWLSRGSIRGSTRTKYERDLRLRVLPVFGRTRLDEITREDVTRWWRAMTRAERLPCHDSTYSTFRTMMGFAVDDRLIDVQPCQVKGAGRPSKKRPITPLTPAQVQAVADAMLHPQWRIGILLGAWCALRSGELRELRRKDISFSKDGKSAVVHVRRAVSRDGNKLVIGPTKTDASVRDMPVPASLVPVLRAHLDKWVGVFPDCLVVADPSGGTIRENTWDRAMKSACRRGLASEDAVKAAADAKRRGRSPNLPDCDVDVWFHDLRKTALTSMATAGATIRELQAMAGHTTADMAMRYQQVAQSHLDDVMEKVSAMVAAS